MLLWRTDGVPSDSGSVEDREPAESRRRTADTDDTVLESREREQSSQDKGNKLELSRH